jgi:DNA-binding CsgD family transcriptional regulator
MGIAAAHLVTSSSITPIQISLIVGLSPVIAGMIIIFNITNASLQQRLSEWGLPIMLVFLVLIPFSTGPILWIAYLGTLVTFFCRSVFNRRALSILLATMQGYPIAILAYGRIANTTGVIIGWVCVLFILEPGGRLWDYMTFFAVVAFMVCLGSFVVADYYPKDSLKILKANAGRWRLCCDKIAHQFELTVRQKEMLFYLARGYSSESIAKSLFISRHTVSSHTQEIYKKLNIHSRQDLLDLIEQNLSP